MWQSILRKNFTRLDDLVRFLELSPEQSKKLLDRKHFGLNLPQRLARKIEKGALDDPLLRQFVPLEEEGVHLDEELLDPVGEQESRFASKLLHKYAHRVLLMPTSSCAMHCRYCFRQHFPYEKGGDLAQELDYIRQDPTIQEVILSGGDPLSLPDRVLGKLLEEIASIPHVQRLRFHTRFLIGIPERITDEFCSFLQSSRLVTYLVLHSNHPKELDEDVLAACRRLREAGAVLLHQAVLARGVNDSIEVLEKLFLLLANHGILAYYLHQLDRVVGSSHFFVEPAVGCQLVEELRSRLPGFAVPCYVREVAGQPSKVPMKE